MCKYLHMNGRKRRAMYTAAEGLPVLTANRDDFDLIQQLAPEGAFIYSLSASHQRAVARTSKY